MLERGARACIHAWKDLKEPVREKCGIQPGKAAMQGLGEFPFLRRVVMDCKAIFLCRIVMDRMSVLVLPCRCWQSVCFSCRDVTNQLQVTIPRSSSRLTRGRRKQEPTPRDLSRDCWFGSPALAGKTLPWQARLLSKAMVFCCTKQLSSPIKARRGRAIDPTNLICWSNPYSKTKVGLDPHNLTSTYTHGPIWSKFQSGPDVT